MQIIEQQGHRIYKLERFADGLFWWVFVPPPLYPEVWHHMLGGATIAESVNRAREAINNLELGEPVEDFEIVEYQSQLTHLRR